METGMSWYNYRTQSFEYIADNIAMIDDDKIKELIPQDVAAQRLYTLYRDMGHSKPEAMIKVLKSVAGIQDSEETDNAVE